MDGARGLKFREIIIASLVNLLAAGTMQRTQEDLLSHAFHLNEHIFHIDLRFISLELVSFSPEVISAQNMYLRVLSQPLHRIPVLHIELTHVLQR